MQDFRNVLAWQRAHALTLAVYQTSRSFPREELFGLTSQMRRAAVSVGGNIAEGCGRAGDREFVRFLRMALGSATELEYYLLLAYDLRILARPHGDRLIEETGHIKRMLAGLIRKVGA
jgi:four helix bundle protein